MNTNPPITSCGPTFGHKCATLLRSTSDVLGDMLQALSEERRASLEALLSGGGSVGIEAVINRNGTNRISLIGLEAEGARHVLATVAEPSRH